MIRSLAARAALGLASALVVSTAAVAQQSPSNPPPSPPQPTTAAMPYMQLAGESDVFEISSSMIAAMRSQNPDVKRYAEMLIDHHTRTTNVLLAQAKAANMPPPPAVLGPQKRAMLDQLFAAAGPALDRLYIQQQIPAHEQALAIHTAYAHGGDTPQLRTAATGAVPFVQQHLAEARRMAGAMGAGM
jgi:putative membrane protein